MFDIHVDDGTRRHKDLFGSKRRYLGTLVLDDEHFDAIEIRSTWFEVVRVFSNSELTPG